MEQAIVAQQPPVEAPRSLPPGPRLPGLVQGFRYARDPIGFYVRLKRRHGGLFSITFPYFGRLVYVADPKLVKQVFTGDPAQYHAGEANSTVLEDALGPNSVLTLDEGEHMRQRKLLLPPFHGESVQRYGELMREITERVMSSWPIGEPFALRPHTQRITLAVILRAVFGVRDRARFERASQLVDEFARRSNLVIQMPFLRRDLGRFSPWGRFIRARDELDEFLYEEIAARRAVTDGAERDDVLSLLLRAEHEDGSPMSDEELRDELVTVIGAGHETTATALAWALERLARHPTDLTTDPDPFIAEVLRTRPVLSITARKTLQPYPLGRYTLPMGVYVAPCIYLANRRGRPIPWGGGTRRCVGAAFAQLELREVLRAVSSRFTLRPTRAEGERMRRRSITLAPSRGAEIIADPLA
jgi:cytochrome P450